MAHSNEHRRITLYLPEEEAGTLDELAQENERSVSAEVRLAVRNWIAMHRSEVPTTILPRRRS